MKNSLKLWTDPNYEYKGREIEIPKPLTEEDIKRNEELFKEEAELVKKNLELEEESTRKNGIKPIDEEFLGFLLANM